MAVSRSPDLDRPPPPSGPGVWRSLIGSLWGRAILGGIVFKLAVAILSAGLGELPAPVLGLDTLASLVIALAAGTLLVQQIALARHRVLWRVRRKLIISYLFIGFVPVVLIVAFFLLGGLFLFFNFASYLLQNRMTAITYRAEAMAVLTALEIRRTGGANLDDTLIRRIELLESEYPGASIAVVPGTRECAGPPAAASTSVDASLAGPWDHVDPPAHVPSWIDCTGFAGTLAYLPADAQTGPGQDVQLLVRAVAFPDRTAPQFAVVVDLPLGPEVRQQLRDDTGVDLGTLTVSGGDARPMDGRPARATATQASENVLPLSSATFLDFRDWEGGVVGQLIAIVHVSIGGIFDRISAGGTFGSVMLVTLVAIGVLFLIIEFAALVAGLSLARSITGSVHELFAGTERVQQGDFGHRISVTAPDQLGQLARSFNSMTASIENLLEQQAEKKRLEEELRIAHEIQMSLLPQGAIQMPGLSVSAICVPAREVGGDYYDFLPIDEHRIGILIADVSGKGTSAALYMAELKGLMLSLSRIYTSPRELLVMANRIISAHLDSRSFITIAYAVIDKQARTMTYARAGHTPLIHLPAGHGPSVARVLTPDGLVLGLAIDDGRMFEQLLQEETIPLGEGDLYVFFTDGISEAMNASDDCFGEMRLSRLVESHVHLPSDELRERVLREIAAFVGDAPQHDDMTMILLRIESLDAVRSEPPMVAAEVGR